jgi:hypothetical protein
MELGDQAQRAVEVHDTSKKEAFMIAAVRKFNIEYQGHWAPVLFIRDTAGATAEPFQFWIRGDDGKPYGVPLNEATDIKADDD